MSRVVLFCLLLWVDYIVDIRSLFLVWSSNVILSMMRSLEWLCCRCTMMLMVLVIKVVIAVLDKLVSLLSAVTCVGMFCVELACSVAALFSCLVFSVMRSLIILVLWNLLMMSWLGCICNALRINFCMFIVFVFLTLVNCGTS